MEFLKGIKDGIFQVFKIAKDKEIHYLIGVIIGISLVVIPSFFMLVVILMLVSLYM